MIHHTCLKLNRNKITICHLFFFFLNHNNKVQLVQQKATNLQELILSKEYWLQWFYKFARATCWRNVKTAACFANSFSFPVFQSLLYCLALYDHSGHIGLLWSQRSVKTVVLLTTLSQPQPKKTHFLELNKTKYSITTEWWWNRPYFSCYSFFQIKRISHETTILQTLSGKQVLYFTNNMLNIQFIKVKSLYK